MNSKKSQIAMYIIVGILILLGLFIVYYTQNKIDQQKTIHEPQLDDVPDHYKLFQNYVVKCLEDVTVEGIHRMGEQGGYVDITDVRYTKKKFKLDSNDPTSSDGVFLSSDHIIPYWWYLESDNKCKNCYMSISNIPSPTVMQDQLKLYIDRNIDRCVADFPSFKEEGFRIKKREVHDSQVTLFPEKAVVQLYYPIEVTKGDNSIDMKNFGSTVNIDGFSGAYALAYYITSREANSQFLERTAMTLVSYFSSIDSQKLPPLSGFQMSPSTTTWLKSEVPEKLKKLLISYIPLFRVEKTKNGIDLESSEKYEQALFDITMIPSNLSKEDLEVNFIYLDWPIFFDITPNNGGLLKPTTYTRGFPMNILPPIQTNHYEFFYDMSFPVIVEIRDKHAFQGQGFSFFFAMEANIRDNKNMLQWNQGEGSIGVWDTDDVELEVNEEVFPDVNSSLLESLKPKKTLICNPAQRIVGPVSLKVSDSKTNRPVGNATITFKCGNYKTCSLGSTDGDGEWESKIPLCVGGSLYVEKHLHRPFVVGNVTTDLDKNVEYVGNMDELEVKKANVKVININQLENIKKINEASLEFAREQAVPLSDSQKVILSLRKENEHDLEPDFMTTAIFEGEQYADLLISPGDYYLQASFVDNAGVVTQAYTERINQQKITYPSINMTPVVLGNIELNDLNGLWKISNSQLDKDSVTFYVFSIDMPRTLKDTEKLSDLENYTYSHRALLEPQFW